MTRPPWLIVIHLPDDTPPADWRGPANLPAGTTACALGAEAAEAVLAAISEDVRP